MISEQECEVKHRELWKWLEINSDKQKFDWPGWKDYPEVKEYSYCFACYVYNVRKEAIDEDKRDYIHCQDLCPLKWNTGSCIETGSWYYKYANEAESVDRKARKRHARKIANLKWR